MDRWPYPFIEMNPDDMAALGVSRAISSRSGTMPARPRPWSIRRRPHARARPSCCSAIRPACRATSSTPGVNELVIPNYKQTWANIRKISDAPEGVKHLTFKSQEYSA